MPGGPSGAGGRRLNRLDSGAAEGDDAEGLELGGGGVMTSEGPG